MSTTVKAIDTLEARLALTSTAFRFQIIAAVEGVGNITNNITTNTSNTASNTVSNTAHYSVSNHASNPNINSASGAIVGKSKAKISSTSPTAVTNTSTSHTASNTSLNIKQSTVAPSSSSSSLVPPAGTTSEATNSSNGNNGNTATEEVVVPVGPVLLTMQDEEIFSKKDSCLYLYLLGNCYRKLAEKAVKALLHVQSADALVLGPPIKTVTNSAQEFISRSIRAFREACSIAASALEISDTLRLACLYALCRALRDLTQEYPEAKAIALTTYESGTRHTHTLTDVGVDVLQRIRDEFLVCELPQLLSSDDVDETNAEVVEEDEDDDDGDNLGKNATSKLGGRGKGKKAKKRLDAALLEAAEQQYAADVLATPDANEKDRVAGEAANATVPSTLPKELQDMVLSIKRGIYIPAAVPLDSFSSGLEIFKALDTIFRVYIRGNALAGLQATGSEVAISHRQLALSKFLLEGPFISWRGFSSALVDFKALSRYDPLLNDSGDVSEKTGSQDGSAANDDDEDTAPLKALQAAIIFIQCSGRSPVKSVSLDQYLSYRFDESKIDPLEPDSWLYVYSWMSLPKVETQKINAGLNFLQFVDALGKCALVAYSKGRVAEMLVTPEEKIEHFFTAYLGLHNRTRWKNILKNRVKKTRAAIQGLSGSRPTLSSSTTSQAQSNQPAEAGPASNGDSYGNLSGVMNTSSPKLKARKSIKE